ncbi:hypothetical protein ACHAXT_005497 [Thalassiosira profunda]
MLPLTVQSRLLVLVALLIAGQTILLTSKLSQESVGSPSFRVGAAPTNPHDIGLVLPDGTVTFTPEEFRAGRHDKYVNLPNVPVDPRRDDAVQQLVEEPVPPPTETLLHQAPPPPGSNAILGLASYPTFMAGWRRLVGSLRTNGYDGHIIVGVNPAIPQEEREYLDKMGVTYYAIHLANCSAAILDGASDTNNAVRAKCSRGLEDLKLEWGRFEMARRWLQACDTCTGWSMVIDTRDIFFQRDPFASLGNPSTAPHELMFVEEVASYTNTLPEAPHRAVNIGESVRYTYHVNPCYGRENIRAYELVDRPMLCSGTVIGTRGGVHRFLTVLVDEFRSNNRKGPECRSPSTTDQWTMNHLYYRGRFGFYDRTKTLPWGTGPVLTVGKPCVNSQLERNGNSQTDMMVFDETTGLILNPHEREGSLARVAPALHQWDRCHKWIYPWFKRHLDLYRSVGRTEDEPAVAWVKRR